jgi:MFS family permease
VNKPVYLRYLNCAAGSHLPVRIFHGNNGTKTGCPVDRGACRFLTLFDLSAVNIALPTISCEFSMDAVTLGRVATAYLLASAVFLVLFGRIADIHGIAQDYFSYRR